MDYQQMVQSISAVLGSFYAGLALPLIKGFGVWHMVLSHIRMSMPFLAF